MLVQFGSRTTGYPSIVQRLVPSRETHGRKIPATGIYTRVDRQQMCDADRSNEMRWETLHAMHQGPAHPPSRQLPEACERVVL